jgi:hypothetical protein
MFFKKTVKVVLVSDSTDRIIDTIKFSKKEFNLFKQLAEHNDMTIDQFFSFALNNVLKQHPLDLEGNL